jgi:hypothetical protein
MSEIPQPPEPPPPPPSSATPARIGRLLVGVLIVLIGLGWLLEVLDVTEFPWDVLLPIALIVVGAALIVTSRSAGGHGALVTTGVVLTVALVLGSAIDFPLEGGVGDRSERPVTASQLAREYELAVGKLTLDLTGLSSELALSGTRAGAAPVRARVGIGQLVVVVPAGVLVRVEARASLGSVRLYGSEEGGFDVQRVAGPGPGVTPVFELELSVGIGQVEVTRG